LNILFYSATSCRVGLIEAQLQLTKFTYCAPVRFAATGARPLRAEDRGQSTSGTLVLCFAARRCGHKNGLRRRRHNPFSSGKFNVRRNIAKILKIPASLPSLAAKFSNYLPFSHGQHNLDR